jgi:transposase
VDHICKTYDVSAKTAEHYVEDWQLNGMMRTEETRKGGPKGLHVLEHFVAAE